MAVSNFYGTNTLIALSPIAGDLQQFGRFEGNTHFEVQNLFAQDDRVAQVRARTSGYLNKIRAHKKRANRPYKSF